MIYLMLFCHDHVLGSQQEFYFALHSNLFQKEKVSPAGGEVDEFDKLAAPKSSFSKRVGGTPDGKVKKEKKATAAEKSKLPLDGLFKHPYRIFPRLGSYLKKTI